MKYQELVESVSSQAGVDPGGARAAAEATVTVLCRALDEPDRGRFVDVLPAELRSRVPSSGVPRPGDQREFVRTVSELAGQSLEEARVRAQTVLSVFAEREPDLVAGLSIPDDLRELFARTPPGGGVTGPAGRSAPLTPDEVTAGLRSLPGWSGGTREIRRTIVLPPGDLDRVLERVRRLGADLGGGLEIRRGADGVELAVHTAAIDAVTAPDLVIAARINELIDETAPGMAAP